MEKAYKFENDTIIIDRKLTELDIFVKDFLTVLKKHCNYLVVSGFVSISTGRTRGTEDVDVLIPKLSLSEFSSLFDDLKRSGFWCYQGDTSKTVYEYVEEMTSIRFARVNELFPNVECIPVNHKKKIQFFEFNNPQLISIDKLEFKIPPIEFEIMYKEIVLGGKKDFDDAKHLRTVFSAILDKEKLKKYGEFIRRENGKV